MTTIINGSSPSITFSDGSAQTSATRPFQNRIINGAMVIDQRNAGASVTPTTDSTYTLDRWKARLTQSSKYSVQQNAGSVTPPVGFTNYLGVTSLSAYSVGASDFFVLQQVIEGFNVADLGFGTANAKTITISFWVRSSLTGTFGGSIYNDGGSRNYPFTYTISAANTWEQKSVTIAGDTSGTWGTINGAGIQLQFGLGVGSTYSGTAGAWAATNYLSATGAVSVVGTNGATFYITGVQLEVGSTATSFDYRPYGTELALCQRYFYLLGKTSTYSTMGIAIGADTTESLYISPLPVTMRATPSYSTAGNLRIYNGATRAVTSSNINAHATPNIPATAFIASGGGLAAGQGLNISANNDVTAYIAFSAEL
jgi:hypothetical protein